MNMRSSVAAVDEAVTAKAGELAGRPPLVIAQVSTGAAVRVPAAASVGLDFL